MKNSQDDFILVKVDGGFCNQLCLIALGYDLQQKGFKVKYDITRLEKGITDCAGNHHIVFEVPKAFPDLSFDIATTDEVKRYQKKYNSYDLREIKFPMYITGSPQYAMESFIIHKNYYRKNFLPPNITELDKIIIKEMNEKSSCAIHFRRGDLAFAFAGHYGYPVCEGYFLQAIDIVKKIEPSVKFYLFSEDILWVEKNIIPKLDNTIEYQICSEHSYEDGYLDLNLISQCNYIIASQGSFGMYGKLLSYKDPMLIVPIYNENIMWNMEHVIFINDNLYYHREDERDRLLKVEKKKKRFKNRIYFAIYEYFRKKLAKKGLLSFD